MNENQIYDVSLGGNDIEFVIVPSGQTTLHVNKTSGTAPLSVPATPFSSPTEAISYLGNAIGKGQSHEQVVQSFTGRDANKLRAALKEQAPTTIGG